MSKTKTHDIGRTKGNNKQTEVLLKRKKTPTTHCIVHTKRLDTNTKRKIFIKMN
jgi:hypothetical protein